MSRESIDLDESEIVDGSDFDRSGYESELDYSMESDKSLKGFDSPKQPTTIEEYHFAYIQIRDELERERTFSTAKKIQAKMKQEALEKEMTELKGVNEALRKENVELKTIIQQLELALEQLSFKKSETLTKLGGTVKRRPKRRSKRN